ncbi:hypothetical protein [Streptomyces hokutonensis]|uniref:hypothetical protein n=1 Tax=Streptomyces hokutonensis TaxID=1306990 RepID=UPI00047618BA|nr:hypothetical protein [Streptomyces hokutonensis]
MADIAYVGETFESLFASGLAEQREDRFGLPVCKCESYRQILYRYIGLASALRSLVTWLASGDPTGEDARGAVDAALSLLGIAAERREWEVVVQLVTAVERVLFVQGHWQAWQHTLAQGITAAQGLGDKAAEAYFTHQQGVQHFLHDRTDLARRLLRRALDLRTELGDTAGAAVTAANLALLEPVAPPPRPPAGPGTPRSWRRVLTAVAAVVAVLVIGTAIGQALGGFGGTGDNSDPTSSSPVGPGSGGTSSGTTTGQTTTGETTTGQTTTGETTTGETTTGNGGTPITLAGPEITPTAQEFGLTHTYPSVEAPVVDFTVTNPNDRAIDLGTPTFAGESGFSYADGTCAQRLEAKASCTVSVEFSPSRVGPESDRLTITSGGHSYTAALTGTGFASLTVKTSGASSRTVTITDSRAGKVCEIESGFDIAIPSEPKPCVVQISDSEQQLTATISDGEFSFLNWSGACASDTDTCVPILTRDTEATAAFSPPSPEPLR